MNVTERARATLLLLARQHRAPTPDAYRLAWKQVADDAPEDGDVGDERGRGMAYQSGDALKQKGNAAHGTAQARQSPSSTRAQRSLLNEMTQLLDTACETVPRLVEEEAWMRQQLDAVRRVLTCKDGVPDHQDFEMAREMLERTATEHERLLQLRRDSLQMVKSVLAQSVDWLQSLTESSDRFGGRLSNYIEDIRNSSDLTALAGVVHGLIEETREINTQFDDTKKEFVAAGSRARQLQDEVERLASELKDVSQLVLTDPLTNLLNRRGLEKSWDELADRCRRDERPLTLAIIDIDDFKRINDIFGHVVGDDVLRRMAGVLAAHVRPDDLVARYGGEEFVVLLPGVEEEDACEVIRRAQQAVADEVHVQGCIVTFSAGVVERSGDTGFDCMIARADDAMYRAKRAGKNRVLPSRIPASDILG